MKNFEKIHEKLNKDKLKILLVGGGGREHALATALAKSPRLGELIIAPGNAGMAELGRTVPVKATALNDLINLALEEDIDLAVVAPEDPLALGLTDHLWALGIPAFGPSQRATRLESSKHFAKQIMEKSETPTAKYKRFVDCEDAKKELESCDFPVVIKADGLALGKGVYICEDKDCALEAVREIMEDHKFGAAGNEVLFEEFLEGPEMTVLVLTDGIDYKLLPTSRDHKRAFDNNEGPNTGGMGVIAPVPEATEEVLQTVEDTIVRPVLTEMNRAGSPFKGVLYCGLMLTADGPKVIEFNARFGDPEAQAVIPLIESDLLDVMLAIIEERLGDYDLKLSADHRAVVVMASGGYPGAYEKGKVIEGLETFADSEEVTVYHCGTREENGKMLTNGGRVLAISARGKDREEALKKAYEAVEQVHFEGAHYRKDIGQW